MRRGTVAAAGRTDSRQTVKVAAVESAATDSSGEGTTLRGRQRRQVPVVPVAVRWLPKSEVQAAVLPKSDLAAAGVAPATAVAGAAEAATTED